MNKSKISVQKAMFAICAGILILIVSQIVSSLPSLLPLPEFIVSIVFGMLYVTIAYFLLKLTCAKLVHLSLGECRIGKPCIRGKWLLVAVLLPVAVSSVLLCMPGDFVRNDVSGYEMFNIVVTALFVVGFGAGVVEEMVFRGFIMTVLEKTWGIKVAIIVPSILFGLLHASGGMNVFDIIILLAAGTSVGIMFSLLVYKTGSVWCSALVHGTWNVIMIGEILNIGSSYDVNAIFSYDLKAQSVLLTGGMFGVEASLAAIAGYVVVIALTWRGIKKAGTTSIKKELKGE